MLQKDNQDADSLLEDNLLVDNQAADSSLEDSLVVDSQLVDRHAEDSQVVDNLGDNRDILVAAFLLVDILEGDVLEYFQVGHVEDSQEVDSLGSHKVRRHGVAVDSPRQLEDATAWMQAIGSV